MPLSIFERKQREERNRNNHDSHNLISFRNIKQSHHWWHQKCFHFLLLNVLNQFFYNFMNWNEAFSILGNSCWGSDFSYVRNWKHYFNVVCYVLKIFILFMNNNVTLFLQFTDKEIFVSKLKPGPHCHTNIMFMVV